MSLKYKNYDVDFSALKGQIINKIDLCKGQKADDFIIFYCIDKKYKLFHAQECCESVIIDDINGDMNDLIGLPILLAEESCNSKENDYGSETWTFYRLATINGYVDIKWYGESNGYYSESVDFIYADLENEFKTYGYK